MSVPEESILDRVRKFLAEHYKLPLEQVTAETCLGNELDDSLDKIEMIMSFEEEFDLAIPNEGAAAMEQVETVGELATFIERYLKEQ